MGERKVVGKRIIGINGEIDARQFYFIEPEEGGDATKVAEELIEMKNVEEVYVADGDYGFLVKTKTENKGDLILRKFLSKRFSKKYGAITTYYNYKK